jgi:uncharacterized protein with NAD-binding domain and iron-sulfur cluster
MTKVAILGGGVGGMSAAHELAERGFEVEVYEKMPHYVGGKARSILVPNSGTDGRKDLPGEHGFRFFPGFYKHITHTMKRIPFPGNKKGVFDNLVASQRVMMARMGKPPVVNIVNFPKTKKDLKVLLNAMTHADTGLTKENVDMFAHKLWQLMTSSNIRRQEVYERITWWQYTEADLQCPDKGVLCPYREYFVGGLTHTLVAAQPRLMSTKTGGDILLQLLFLMLNPRAHADRVLNAPTNDAWLWPWYRYLTKDLKVKYHHGMQVTDFECDPKSRKITGVKVKDITQEGSKPFEIKADYYISAIPVEHVAPLVNNDMIAVDNTLSYLKPLAKCTNWMNGIQFFLNEDVKLVKGHVIFLDSPWALTCISQVQFWPHFKINKHGNGEVKGILSVDISDWHKEGLNGKKAEDCNYKEIVEEVWAQMKRGLKVDGKDILRDDMMVSHTFLDPDIIIEKHAGNIKDEDAEKLLVNEANTWGLRPEAYCGIENLFFASDFVRTNTDLATMEGANEAARRAVNCIISATGAKVPKCKVWKLHEPWVLSILRWIDKRRYKKGMPWKDELPFVFKLLHELMHLAHRLFKFK